MEEVKLKGKPTIIISNELQLQIDYLHDRVGEKEWSGILFYDVVDGSITDPDNLVIKCTSMYPLDIGSAAYTEYNASSKLIDAFEAIEGSEDQKRGHIHTHHKMGAYFSGTDNDELSENAEHFNYYLSVVVDFKCQPVAKIAIQAESKNTIKITDDEFKEVEFETESNSLFTMTCTVVREVPPFKINVALEEINKANAKKAKALANSKTYSRGKTFSTGFNSSKGNQPKNLSSNINSMLGIGSEDLDDDWDDYYKQIEQGFHQSVATQEEFDLEKELNPFKVLGDLGVIYGHVEDLTATILTKDLQNDVPLPDVIDSAYNVYKKDESKVPAIDEEELVKYVDMFKDFHNLEIPRDVIVEAVGMTLHEVKDKSVKPDLNYNDFIDFVIINLGN